MIGLGVDESAALAVEPDGSARIYATDPDGIAWIVDGSACAGSSPAARWMWRGSRSSGVGPDRCSHLPLGTVDNPLFTRYYAAAGGTYSEVPRWSLAIHGGAGVLERGDMTPEKERLYRAGLDAALQAGGYVLDQGGSSLDAVQAAVRVLEDNPLFNAGQAARCSTPRAATSSMRRSWTAGRRRPGAVAALTTTRNPIDAARAVMDHSRHVLLTGPGADVFARRAGHPAGRSFLFPHRGTLEQLPRVEEGSPGRDRPDPYVRHGRRGGGGCRGQPRRRDLDRRAHRQAMGPDRRFPDHRRGHLCQERRMRGLGHRHRRVLHPRKRRAAGVRPGGVEGREHRRRGPCTRSWRSARSAATAG